MKIYLDDDADGSLLIIALQSAGFEVLSPRNKEINMRNRDDLAHLERATKERATILTFNCKDFRALHKDWENSGKVHAGILVVYKYNNPKKDLAPADIAKAIKNILVLHAPIEKQLHVLNDYNY